MPIFEVNRRTDGLFLDNLRMGAMRDRVKTLRKVMGLSQAEAAGLAKIAQSSWSDIEKGETTADDIKGKTLLGVARALRTTPWYVLENKGPVMSMTPENDDEIKLLATFRDLKRRVDQGKVLGYIEGLALEQPVASGSAPFKTRGGRSPKPGDASTKGP